MAGIVNYNPTYPSRIGILLVVFSFTSFSVVFALIDTIK